MLLGTLGATLLGNLLTDKEVIWTSEGAIETSLGCKWSVILVMPVNISQQNTIRAG